MSETQLIDQVEDTKETHTFQGGSADARAYRRRSVLWPAKLIVGQHDFNCQVWNLSLGGARIKIDLPIKDKASVMLAIAGRGSIPATVSWCKDGKVGLAFDLPPEEVRVLFLDRADSLGFESFTKP